jgi:MYXO-CTERM domain-containing protein
VWSRVEEASGNFVWHGVDFPSKSLTSLESADIQVASNGNFVFTFQHRYSFEVDPSTNWDGAVIEITDDGGAHWKDVSQFASPGYTGQITNVAENPLSLRQAFTGESAGYPAMKPVTLDFGAAFAGKTVRLRFVIGTDLASGAPGWDIDNIGVVFVKNTPFSIVIDDEGTCNGVPSADAGPDQAVLAGSLVQLDASSSSDPDGDALSYTWKQNAGAAVDLLAGQTPTPVFLAPEVAAPTLFTFEVTAGDGKGSSSDTVDVVVKPKPVVVGTGGAGGEGGSGGMAGTGGAGGSGGMAGSGGGSGGMGGMGTGGSTTTTTTTTTATTSSSGGEGGDDGGEKPREGSCSCSAVGEGSDPTAPASAGALAALLGLIFRKKRDKRAARR